MRRIPLPICSTNVHAVATSPNRRGFRGTLFVPKVLFASSLPANRPGVTISKRLREDVDLYIRRRSIVPMGDGVDQLLPAMAFSGSSEPFVPLPAPRWGTQGRVELGLQYPRHAPPQTWNRGRRVNSLPVENVQSCRHAIEGPRRSPSALTGCSLRDVVGQQPCTGMGHFSGRLQRSNAGSRSVSQPAPGLQPEALAR